jgi:hypothetical protein
MLLTLIISFVEMLKISEYMFLFFFFFLKKHFNMELILKIN